LEAVDMDMFNAFKGIQGDIADAVKASLPRHAVVTRAGATGVWVRFTPVDASVPEMWFPSTVAGLPAGTAGWVHPLAGGKGRFIADEVPFDQHVLDVKKYGAVGDGVADDTAALQAAVAAVPGISGSTAGIDIILPAGTYKVSDTIDPNKPGVRIRGASGWGTRLVATASLTAGNPVLRLRDNAYINRGPQVADLQIDMTNSLGADGIEIVGAYDNASLRDILIYGLNGNSKGVSMIPNPAASIKVGQSIYASNVQVVGKSGNFTGHAWHVIDMQEVIFTGCKGIGGAETGSGGTGWYIEGCLGLVLDGCSAAKAAVGFDIRSRTTRECGYITIDTPTLEGLVSAINIQGNASEKVKYVALRSPRPQVGASLSAGPSTLAHTVGCDLETRTLDFTIASTCAQTHVVTLDVSKITNNGIDTSIVEWANGNNGMITVHNGMRVHAGGQRRFDVGSPGANQTAALVFMNAGGSPGMRWVEVGAADSGGAGYRMLRVLN